MSVRVWLHESIKLSLQFNAIILMLQFVWIWSLVVSFGAEYNQSADTGTDVFSRQKNIYHDFHGRESNAIWPHVRKFLVTLRQPVKEVEYK